MFIFKGQVQGVGFRYACQMFAMKNSLTGYARNLFNGDVEAVFQGDEDTILRKFTDIYSNSRWIEVEDYAIKEIAVVEDEKNFKITY